MAINVPQTEAYIRQAARQRGIDPEVAVRVARSEGLAPGVWQSNVSQGGRREPSYGPFQLLVGGQGTGYPTGLGNAFMEQTGMDPRDPGTVQAQVDFALDQAKQGGWSPWYGAAKAGVGDWTGIRGAKTTPPSPSSPAGGARAASDPNSSKSATDQTTTAGIFGSMAPQGSGLGWSFGGTPQQAEAVNESIYGKKEEGFGDRLAKAGKALDEEIPDAPRVGRVGDARQSGNSLLEFLNSPTAAETLLKKRLSGIV